MVTQGKVHWLVVLILSVLWLNGCVPVAPAAPSVADPGVAKETPGVSDSEIVIGTHTSLTGPVAVFAPIPQAAKAYFDYINATEGGVYGRKITFLLEDDGYSPPKTVELVRKLVEQDQIFALFQGLGSPTHLQVLDYLQEQGVPDLYITASAVEWIEAPTTRRMSFGGILSNVGEAAALGQHLAAEYTGKKLGLLYQNDNAGLGFVDGMKRTLGDKLPIVAEVVYEATDQDLNAQVDRLKAAGAEVIGGLITPRLLSTAIKYARLDLQWDAPFFISHVSANDFLVALGGADVIEGTVSVQYLRQAYETDHPGVAKHAEIMKSYGGMESINFLTIVGQYQAELLVETLKRAGKDLTREGLIKAAESIQNFQCSVCLFPMSMSAADHDPAQSAVFVRAEGGRWVPFGDNGVSWEDTLPQEISTENVKVVASPYSVSECSDTDKIAAFNQYVTGLTNGDASLASSPWAEDTHVEIGLIPEWSEASQTFEEQPPVIIHGVGELKPVIDYFISITLTKQVDDSSIVISDDLLTLKAKVDSPLFTGDPWLLPVSAVDYDYQIKFDQQCKMADVKFAPVAGTTERLLAMKKGN